MVAPSAPSNANKLPPFWLLLSAGCVVTALSLGVRSTFGLFLDPVVDTIGSGRGAFALAIAIQNLVWGLSQPLAGAVADRFGSARVLAIGGVIYAIGMMLMANAESSGALYLSAGFIVGAGTGAASFAVVLAAIGRMAPPAKRSMALGVATAMGSVGQFILVPVVQRMIDANGWRNTSLLLAATILTVGLFAPGLRGRAADMIALGSSEHGVPLRSELRRAAHSNSYRLLNLAFFVCGFHVTFIATHLASYAEDIGQTRSIAASALALIGLFNIVGSLTAGALGGRYSKTKLLSGIYAARAIVIAGFVLVPTSSTTTLVFGGLIGLLWLSTVPLTSGIVASQFGTAHTGTLFGIVFLSHQIGAFVGAWLGGTLADRFGSYGPVWWIAVALGVFAAAVHLAIDEGPQPEPPPAIRVGTSTAGGFAAVVLFAFLSISAMASLSIASARTELGDGYEAAAGPPPYVSCVLHPVRAGSSP